LERVVAKVETGFAEQPAQTTDETSGPIWITPQQCLTAGNQAAAAALAATRRSLRQTLKIESS
jgi:hypothetical protein